MAKGSNVDVEAFSQLAHPVYLDTEMLISFLASLEDGVSYSSEVAEHYAAAKDREGEGAGKVSLPSIATLLGLTLSAEGRYKRRTSTDEGVESKFVREHAAASLFNRLRLLLGEMPGAVVQVDAPEKIAQLDRSSLVEIEGEIVGNPLKQILDLLAMIGPYIGLELEEPAPQPTPTRQQGSRSGKRGGQGSVPQLGSVSGQQTPELGLTDLLRLLKREVERSPVMDLLMETSGGVKTVLTVSRELLSPEVEAYLIGGRFKVIGKASAVLDANGSISLLRRTAFGFGGRELADNMFGEFNKAMTENSDGLNLSIAQTVIDGPAIQLLPLAIYL